VTTPESLYLLLTAQQSRAMLATVRTVIVDEFHAVIGTRRGAHLALSLERLQQVAQAPLLRIGVSATQKPIEEVARFLVGGGATEPAAPDGAAAPPTQRFTYRSNPALCAWRPRPRRGSFAWYSVPMTRRPVLPVR
jgi:ATP-dependent Lhr-like helicase